MKTKLLFVLTFFVFQFSFADTKILTVPFLPNISPLTYCDSNNDGFGVFDLGAVTPVILAAQSSAASDYTISYHETMADAVSGTSPITAPYSNINPFTQTIYYVIEQISSGDASIGSFQLVVNAAPVATVPGDYHLCDSNGAVGYETFNLNIIVPEVLGSIDPSTVSVSFYTSQSDAENGVNAIANASNYINATVGHQTIYVRVESNPTGCYDLVTLHLIVDPLPQSTQPNYPPYRICNYSGLIGYETFDLSSRISSILLGQTGMNVTFFPSLIDAQNGTNQISNPSSFVNMVIYVQTLGIRITNQATGCYVISTMDIMVEPLPQLTAPAGPYAVCDADQDGAAFFDLTTLVPGLLNGSSYSITFHETINDAEMGVSSISPSSSFMNINPFTQTIYVRGQETITTGCYTVLPIELLVNPAPIVDSLPSLAVCDTDSNPLNGVAFVDLTQQTMAILALQTIAPSNFTVTFYTSQLLAQSGSAPIITASNFLGSNGQAIWYRVENNSTNCYNVGSFQLIVSGPFALTTPTPLKVCDNDANPNDQHTTFDLTVKNNEISGLTGYPVTYYTSLADAQADVNAISNPNAYINVQPTVQTLGVRVTSPAGCVSLTTLDIRVYPVPTPNTNPPALVPQCDVNNTGDMLEVFDLTANAAYIMNGDPNMTLHFYSTIADANTNTNTFLSPTAALVGTNVWIRVENTWTDYQGNHCYVLVEQPLTVNPLPNPVLISNNTLNTVYVDGSNNVVQPLTLETQLSGNYSFEWEVDGAPIPDATSSVYAVNTASPTGVNRTFVVMATDLITGCTASSSIVVVQSSGTPSPLGDISQTFNPGDTLAYLSVSGSNILWYAAASDKNTTTTYSTPLPLSTPLVNNTTYYASQTIGGLESIARLPVTVSWALGLPDNEIASLKFAPNPVKNNLVLHSTVIIKSVSVYTILGQKVFEQNYNDTNINIDLSRLSIGNYILKAQGETEQKTIRIVKE